MINKTADYVAAITDIRYCESFSKRKWINLYAARVERRGYTPHSYLYVPIYVPTPIPQLPHPHLYIYPPVVHCTQPLAACSCNTAAMAKSFQWIISSWQRSFSDLRPLIGSFKSFSVGNSLKAYLHTLAVAYKLREL